MSVVGSWKMFYDWGCDGGYSSTTWTINANGTFTTPSYTGKWIQNGGVIILLYNSSTTVYAGNVNGSAMVGAMTTFSGLTGCWYATGPGAPSATAAATTSAVTTSGKAKAQADESGKS